MQRSTKSLGYLLHLIIVKFSHEEKISKRRSINVLAKPYLNDIGKNYQN